MGLLAKGAATLDQLRAATPVIGDACRDMLGSVGGMVAIIGIIILPITSGDTALRSLRLMIGEFFNIDQRPAKNRVIISSIIFALVAGILYWAKMSPGGFLVLWRYFAWSNQTLAVFAFAIITIYLLGKGYATAPYMSLIPGAWYMFITTAFICNAGIGLNLPYWVAMGIGAVLAVVYSMLVWWQGLRMREGKLELEAVPQY
jgi:carbon starvation protein CstA